MVTRYSRRDATLWPRAAVFDCDGLLVDSAACWERAYGVVAAELGRSPDAIGLDALAGASVAIAARRLTADLGCAVDERRLRRALRDSFAADPPPVLPGAQVLVAALAERVPVAVASNAPREIVLAVLDRVVPAGTFNAIVSAEQTRADKPAPDVYIEACRRLGVAACDAIAFEDSTLGARAARAAGLLVVAVPSVPGARLDADLTVDRLDDPRLLEYLAVVTTGR